MNPQRLDRTDVLESDGTLDFSDVDRFKRYDCTRYDSCVRIAAKRGWPQFHCCACPAYEALPDDHYARPLFVRARAPLIDSDALTRSQPSRVEPAEPIEPVDPEAAERERYERRRAQRRKGAATRSARLARERERMREILLAQAETEQGRKRINAILDGRMRPSAIERAQLQVLRERVRANPNTVAHRTPRLGTRARPVDAEARTGIAALASECPRCLAPPHDICEGRRTHPERIEAVQAAMASADA